ncbi:unnamed protein product [Linum tenue]|uniref:Uncharacterized protein n=1 Tax=Linum tenue TaxID=586396 RepID=A0AAV0RY38_9ROSI|nr:unnamed protein product [Linum tenue]CAI0561238.1 unnamed protein product [Linum tenue]
MAERNMTDLAKLEKSQTKTQQEIEEQQQVIRQNLHLCLSMILEISTLLKENEPGPDKSMPDEFVGTIREKMIFAREFVQDESHLTALRKAFVLSHADESTSGIPDIISAALKAVVATLDQAFVSYKRCKAAISCARAATLAHRAARLVDGPQMQGNDERATSSSDDEE